MTDHTSPGSENVKSKRLRSEDFEHENSLLTIVNISLQNVLTSGLSSCCSKTDFETPGRDPIFSNVDKITKIILEARIWSSLYNTAVIIHQVEQNA